VTHEVAINNKAAERYTLGEMETDERDNFEEHFMTCGECAADMRAISTFVANATEVFRTERESAPEPEQKRVGWSWLWRPSMAWAAVAACSLCVVAYQNVVVLPRSQAPQIFQTRIIKGEVRGNEQVVLAQPGQAQELKMDVNVPARGSEYSVEMVTPSGTTVWKAPADGHISLMIPASGVKTGSYRIVVRDAGAPNGPELGRYQFAVHLP